MALIGPREGGRTARWAWGFPHGPGVGSRIGAGFAVAALALATWGLLTAAAAIPEAGVDFEAPPGSVLWVLPGGPAWHDGVRVGQSVVAVSTGESALDWSLRTSSGPIEYRLPIEGAAAELRGLIPLAAAALLVSLLASGAVIRFPRSAGATASLAGMAGSISLMFGGHPIVSSIGGLLTLGFPVAWLVAVGVPKGPTRLGVGLAGLVVAIAWVMARFGAPGVYDAADAVRLISVGIATLATVAFAVDVRRAWSAVRSAQGPVVLDLLGIGAASGVALALWAVVGLPSIAVAAGFIVAAVLYWRTRRPLVRAIDRLVFGEREERASVAAVEAERGRVARELHDEPLQELSAVIRRLETTPQPATEAGRLREVAVHLRAVATDLHPPVLDDLGLGPALPSLAEQADANGSAIGVVTTLDDRTGTGRGERLPPNVELAIYRIVGEAVGNAQRHSGGTRVEIAGRLTADLVELTVSDDGVGLSEDAAQRAARAGHLGILSMRQRAAAIGAELSVGPRPEGGTAVVVRWRR